MDRECYKCVYYTNSCTKWSCQFETLEEHDKQIRKETLIELWKRAIYMHDEYVEYEELDNIIDEMLKEQK